MMMQTIATRISQCVDDLGLLLDQIYKFPQRQRETYFQKIQGYKNKLLALKTNLRQNNSIQTQKQYKQIYLLMNTLKNEISQNLSVISIQKQNRQGKIKQKDQRKNHDEAMRLIVQKDQIISQLKCQLGEVQQNFHILQSSYQLIKGEFTSVQNQNKILKYQNQELQIQLAKIRTNYHRNQSQLQELLIYEKDSIQKISKYEEQNTYLRQKLDENISKIYHFEQLAEISMRKTKIAEQNIKKVEQEAHDLNQNFRVKESDNYQKLRQIQELDFELSTAYQQIKQLSDQNKRFREDIQVLENEITQSQNQMYRQKSIFNEQKQKHKLQINQWKNKLQNSEKINEEIKNDFAKIQDKYSKVLIKLNSAEQAKFQLKRNEENVIYLQQLVKNLQNSVEQNQNEKRQKNKQNERLFEQLQKSLSLNKQIQIELIKAKQKIKLKEDDKVKLNYQIENCHRKIRQFQGKSLNKIEEEHHLKLQNSDLLSKLIKIQDKLKQKDKEIQNLKIRLFRAKIQTLHNIREVIA